MESDDFAASLDQVPQTHISILRNDLDRGDPARRDGRGGGQGAHPLFLNVSLLFFVSVEPYLFNLMIASTSPVAGVSNEDWWLYVSSLYAVDLGSLFFILGMYNVAALSSGRGLLSGEDQRHLRASRNAAIVSAAFIFVSIAPAFGSWIVFSGVPMRAILWFAPLALMRGQRYLSRRPPFANRGPGSAPP